MSITVVIVSYKYGHLVSQSIESILSQTKKPEKILVVDDGVGDIKPEYKEIEYLLRKENLGIVQNFNDVLFNHIFTDRVLFLGADNWLRSDTLEKMSLIDADIVSTDICLFGTEAEEFAKMVGGKYENGYWIWKFRQGDIERGNYIHGSSLYNVKLAKDVGGYEKNKNSQNSEEDWMLWKKMIKSGAKHCHIQEPLLYYRRHKNNFQI